MIQQHYFFKKSSIESSLILFLHILAFIVVITIRCILWIKLCLIVLFGFLALRAYRKKSVIVMIRYRADGEWLLEFDDGKQTIALLQGQQVQTRYVIFLRFQPLFYEKKQKFLLLIWPDSLNKIELQQLRVLVRTSRSS